MYYCIILTASFALKDNKQQALLSRKIEITHIIIIDYIYCIQLILIYVNLFSPLRI